MTFTTTDYKYVQLDEHNVPIIAGTTMKVVELITSVKAHGWNPEELHKGQNRILLVMATGTGKTFTAFQIIWRLWKSLTKKRILFLAIATFY